MDCEALLRLVTYELGLPEGSSWQRVLSEIRKLKELWQENPTGQHTPLSLRDLPG